MTSSHWIALSLSLAALAFVLIAALLVRVMREQARSSRTLEQALEQRARQVDAANLMRAVSTPASGRSGQSAPHDAAGAAPEGSAGTLRAMRNRLAKLGARWLDTRLGKLLVASEDQLLIEQCGFVDPRARAIFLATRVMCGLGAPLAASFTLGGTDSPSAVRVFLMLFIALCIGFMIPKWGLGRIAAGRRQSIVDELPMLIDLLRLLQGVGLSIDQSVQVIVGEFRSVIPVLSQELEMANRQFVTGRTREQSMQRLSSTYDNDDLRAVTRLIVQVDRHGGAVQEPLKQFAERLREGRRTAMRERIGKLTVKMTTVMITTLLPALLIVTAGPGFLAVIRSLSALANK